MYVVPGIGLGALFSRSPPPPNFQRSFFFCYSRKCFRFRGCPVLPPIELSVSAPYKTGVLRCARRLTLVEAASGSVRPKVKHHMQSDCSKRTIVRQSKYQKITIFQVPLPPNYLYQHFLTQLVWEKVRDYRRIRYIIVFFL